MIGSAYISITDPLMVITVAFLPNKPSNFEQDNKLWARISLGNVMMCRINDMNPLLLGYLPTFIRYIRMIGSAHVSIFDLPMVITA